MSQKQQRSGAVRGLVVPCNLIQENTGVYGETITGEFFLMEFRVLTIGRGIVVQGTSCLLFRSSLFSVGTGGERATSKRLWYDVERNISSFRS